MPIRYLSSSCFGFFHEEVDFHTFGNQLLTTYMYIYSIWVQLYKQINIIAILYQNTAPYNHGNIFCKILLVFVFACQGQRHMHILTELFNDI